MNNVPPPVVTEPVSPRENFNLSGPPTAHVPASTTSVDTLTFIGPHKAVSASPVVINIEILAPPFNGEAPSPPKPSHWKRKRAIAPGGRAAAATLLPGKSVCETCRVREPRTLPS